MNKIKGFKCFKCSKEYEENKIEYTCPSCGSNVDVVYNYEFIKSNLNQEFLKNNKDRSIRRYIDVLPISDISKIPILDIGWTPLYHLPKLGKELGCPDLYIKDDGKNPSGSLKDRASVVVLVKALERGEKLITGASTGNAGSSLACLAANVGLPVNIFVPEKAPRAKIAQLLIFGARVLMVKGTYDQAFELCLQATQKYGWYNRNTGYNPYTREGKKVCSYEICEQLNFNIPDKVFIPVGDGNIISGIWKGFKDFYNLGIIDKLPQLVAVQSEGSSAIVNAINNNGKIKPVKANTIADSISVDIPRDGTAAVKAVFESNGIGIRVSDNEIIDTIKFLGSKTGIFGEPAGVTGLAGLRKMFKENKINEKEKICVLVTGNGLKDIDSAIKAVVTPNIIEPDLKFVT